MPNGSRAGILSRWKPGLSQGSRSESAGFRQKRVSIFLAPRVLFTGSRYPGMNRDNDGFAGRYIFFFLIYIYTRYMKNPSIRNARFIDPHPSFSHPVPCRFREVSRTVGSAKSPAGRLAGRDITLGRESEWWNTGCWSLDLQRPLGCWTMRFKLKSQPGSFRSFFLQCCFFVQSANQKKKLWKSI